MKSSFLSILAVAAIVYIALCAFLYFFQKALIYFPTPTLGTAAAEELWLENDAERIRIWRLHAGQQNAILYFGGNAEDVALNIPEFSELFPDFTVYLVNYRGYGGSSGSPGETSFYDDAVAAFDLVRDSHAGVSVLGRSIGGAVAAHLAAARAVDKVILITPFDSLKSLARKYYPVFPVSLLLREQFDALGYAPRIDAPVLLLVAERDEIVPRDSVERLAHAFDPGRARLAVIEGTGHNTIGTSPEYGRTLRDFMYAGQPL